MSLISYSPLIVGATGKTGTDTFKTIHSNPILQKTFQRMTNNKYIDRNQRCLFVSLTKSWALLDESVRLQWRSLAIQINAGSIHYYNNKVSGFSLFMSFQLNNLAIGNTGLIDCPDFSQIYMPNLINLHYFIDIDDFSIIFDTVNGNPVTMILQASDNCSPGISNNNVYKTIHVADASVGTHNFAEGTNFNTRFNNWNQSGTKIFFRIKLVSYYWGFSSHFFHTSMLIP
jgi:hypothetical protein